MEKNIQSYDELCEELESNFKELGYGYKKINLDEDANYILSVSTEKSELESIRKLKTIDGLLIYVDVKYYSLNIIATNVYKINPERDINTYYKLVNDVNSNINIINLSLLNILQRIKIISCIVNRLKINHNVTPHFPNLSPMTNAFIISRKLYCNCSPFNSLIKVKNKTI